MDSPRFEIYEDAVGKFRWRLISSDGHVTATSGEAHATFDSAARSVDQLRAQSVDAPVVREPVEA